MVYIFLHIITEFAIPTIIPHIYDSLGNKELASGKSISRRKLAADARTKIVASAMALYVVPLSFWALFISKNTNYQLLRLSPYESTPLTQVRL